MVRRCKEAVYQGSSTTHEHKLKIDAEIMAIDIIITIIIVIITIITFISY